MFLWSFRDPLGIGISIAVTLTWIIWFVLCSLLNRPGVEIALLVIAISATILASALVCRNADRIEFANDFSRQHAFPADAPRERAVLVWHISILMLFFLPSLLYILVLGNGEANDAHPLFLLSSLIVGPTGFFGVIHHFTRRACSTGRG